MSKVTIKFWSIESKRYWEDWEVDRMNWAVDRNGDVLEFCVGGGYSSVNNSEPHYYKDDKRIA